MSGRLFRAVSQIHGDIYENQDFGSVKIASKTKAKDDGNNIKDLAIILGGSALGAGAGYGLSRLARDNIKSLRKIDPKDRLKYVIPALGLTGAGIAIAKAQQNNYTKREKTASYYLETK